MMAQTNPPSAPHIPVLLEAILDNIAPVQGTWVDGTFGAGGYSRALLDAGASHVFAIDQDPEVFERAAAWADDFANLTLIEGRFGQMDQIVLSQNGIDGVVLDIGVSSMQIDQGIRGFSFAKPGPLDMRMSQQGKTAADLVNQISEGDLADLLFQFGEERASRRIARAIVKARKSEPIETTQGLAAIIEGVMPRPKPGQVHPATRSFQALRIAVNDELGQLVQGLAAAEALLSEGGILAVVTFHSLEDRIVKRFLQMRAGRAPRSNRYQPLQETAPAQFQLISRKAIAPSAQEIAQNPRARSAKLRLARRTDAPVEPIDFSKLGIPKFDLKRIM